MYKEFRNSLLVKIGIIALILLLIYYLRNVLLPFALSFVIAYILNPIVKFVERLVKRRIIAVIITLISVTTIFTAIIAVSIPVILNESNHLYTLLKTKLLENQWDGHFAEITAFIKKILENLETDEKWSALLNSGNISSFTQAIMPKIASFFSKTFNLITSILGLTIIILYTIFIMKDYEEISRGAYSLIPAKHQTKFNKFIERFQHEIKNYFRGQVGIVICVMILYSIGFTIIGLPMGFVLGIFIGLLNLVPYLQIVGFLPAFCLALTKALENNSPFWIPVALTALVFVTVQIIQDMILTPKIMGKSTGLNPAMILLSLSVWGKLLGFLGLIVAIPFTCLVRTYYNEYLKSKEDEKTNNNLGTDSFGQNGLVSKNSTTA